MAVFTHLTLGTNDLNKARSFYDSVLSKIGLKRIADLGDNGSIWGKETPSFFVVKPADGNQATVGNGVTVSFEAPDRSSVDAFYATALDAGARDEGAAGPRGWAPNAYAAYVRDKLKEVFRRYQSQPVDRVVELINPVLRGWVNYFAVGHSSECFSFIKDWVEKKIRRHMGRSRNRRGFGWKRWSRRWL